MESTMSSSITKNEKVAKWMGYPIARPEIEFSGKRATKWIPIIWKFDQDYDLLHESWVKFRDLKFDDVNITPMQASRYEGICWLVESAITRKPIAEAFDELVKGIEWVESLKK